VPIYNFACECGEVTEARAGYETGSLPCPACGQAATRSAVYQIALGTKEKKYRVTEFQEASQELEYAHGQQERREGRKVKWPSPYKAGLKEAARRGARIRRR
jgi:hypothetical protein